MIAALTTSRKATAGALVACLSPLYAVLQSGQDLTWRILLASLAGGVLGWAAVWAPANTEPYEPRHAPRGDG